MGLALSDSAYKRLCSATVAYVRPTDPGKFIPGELAGTDLVHARQDHEDLVSDFLEVNVLERTVINQLQSAFDRSILLPKTNKISGLITCSIPEFFKYLFRAYGNITAISLADAHYNVTKHQYVHANPIETVFDKIQDYANIAEACGTTEPEVQLIEMALIIIMYAIFFYIADLKATVASNQQANQVSLPSTTSSTTDDTLQLLLTKFEDLESEVKAAKINSGTGSGSDGNKKNKKKKKEQKDRKYCWTHGSCAHDGKECNNPNEGHKKEATFANMLGGSTKDCYWLQSTSA